MLKFCRLFFISIFFTTFTASLHAQVSSVTFGKNRVQYRKLHWQYYQSENFNVYFYEQGQELAKYVLQIAEKELPEIEAAAEYSLQRRANIIVYNNYADFSKTNVGLNTDIMNTNSTTKLVNNKLLVYYDANHYNLRIQIREGLADVITKNLFFGDDVGEVASNQALLSIPQWLTDGYVAYLGEHWNTALDDELKADILQGKYKRFSRFSFEKPLLAGHAFWYYIEEQYKKENVTYFLYLARTYKNLNKACLQITGKNFKQVCKDFLAFQEEKYDNDAAKRQPYPKGSFIESFEINPRLNYYRFNVNPQKKNNSYVVTQFKKGIVRVIYNDEDENHTILKYGVRTYSNQVNPNYPMMAWDPKGAKIAVVYETKGKLRLLVYDMSSKFTLYDIDLSEKFDQIQDVKYMLDNRTLLLSAVRNGHSDIYTFDIEKEKYKQLTDDVYDDLDPSFVTFPNKSGIIFSSNRPNADATGADTSLPCSYKYNVFLVTDFGDQAKYNQISQLSDQKYGNARFPAQYNVNHFTYVSDENGIANRYAGFFTTKKIGVDTMVTIGGKLLRNPQKNLSDSLMLAYGKTSLDSVSYVTLTADSAFTFPISNYESNLAETRTAGEARLLSEVTNAENEKNLYKIPANESVLKNRNITARPSTYGEKLMRESERTNVNPAKIDSARTSRPNNDGFQSEFENEHNDSLYANANVSTYPIESLSDGVLSRARLFKYKPIKFSANFGSLGFNTNILYNRLQPYGGGAGPIMLTSNTPLNGLITMGASDLMEDHRINGGFKISTNFKDNEWFVNYQNLKRKIDWGITYYRNVIGSDVNLIFSPSYREITPGKLFTNLYQANVSYPFDESKSIRLSTGLRSDNLSILNNIYLPITTVIENQRKMFSLTHLEFIYDNSLNRQNNILNGLRYKAYIDWNRQIHGLSEGIGPTAFNFGFDARYYYPIYKDFIWAGRVAGDFSWGNQKTIYYLGGVDGWLMFGNNIKPGTTRERYFNSSNVPSNDVNYAFQSLAVNMRGYIQNVANGNNTVVINSEFRLPVLSTIFDRTVSNAFLRDLQFTQFIDLGTAWTGAARNIKRPEVTYSNGPVEVKIKSKGVGPFAGGYGFGARSTLLGYFVKYDIGWPMTGFFKDRPIMYVSLGLDF
jgi:hypothetical protein